jgi:hypothetical protein
MPLNLPSADRIRLLHMLDAARQPLQFSAGRDRQSLDTDLMYRRAVINCIQEIGEAAVRVSDPTRALIPQLPWQQIGRHAQSIGARVLPYRCRPCMGGHRNRFAFACCRVGTYYLKGVS